MKTEHAGPKRGQGAFWGRKKAAKRKSSTVRRQAGQREVRHEVDTLITSQPNRN